MEGPLGWSSCERGCWGQAGDRAGALGVGRSESSLWGERAWPGWGGGRGEMGVQDCSVCSCLRACCEVYRGQLGVGSRRRRDRLEGKWMHVI